MEHQRRGIRLKEVASKPARARCGSWTAARAARRAWPPLGYVGRRDIFSMTVDGIPISGDIRCGDRVRVPDQGFRRVKCVYGARMVLHRVAEVELGDPWTRNEMAIVAAHEFGHVLGLRHAKNTCAVMSYQRESTARSRPASGRSAAASSRPTTWPARSAATAAGRTARARSSAICIRRRPRRSR